MSVSTTPISLDAMRRAAKRLARAYGAGHRDAIDRVAAKDPRPGRALRHSDFLHVIAREEGFASWPAAKFAEETIGMDRAQRRHRLRLAVYHGQHWMVERLLADDPGVSEDFALSLALFDRAGVERRLHEDPGAAQRVLGPRRPILHLAFSRHLQAAPEKEADMLAIAEALLAHGADVNDSWEMLPGQPLSVLYAAIGHAGNMPLSRWLLEHGANPNDGESLYHATELGHHQALDMLLAHGADPRGTNALLRAMDFNDHGAVRKLLAAGADVNGFAAEPVGGELPYVIPALHQAARRGCDAEMAELLLGAGADPKARYQGVTPYAFARIFGSGPLQAAIEARGADVALTGVEAMLAAAAEDADQPGRYVDPVKLPEVLRQMIGDLVPRTGALPHIRRLVALGVETDHPDGQGMTPLHVAGWEGRADVTAYLLSLSPDLSHMNGYGGTLFSTILHGADNCAHRATRDHVGCMRLALEEGVALPRRALGGAGGEDMQAFLSDWAARYPGQVIEGGVV